MLKRLEGRQRYWHQWHREGGAVVHYKGDAIGNSDGKLRLPEPKGWTLDVVTGEAMSRN